MGAIVARHGKKFLLFVAAFILVVLPLRETAEGKEAPAPDLLEQTGADTYRLTEVGNWVATELEQTHKGFDWGIQGDGWFQLERWDGVKMYTRDGRFIRNAQGVVMHVTGHKLSPEISVPENAVAFQLSRDAKLTSYNSEGLAVSSINLQVVCRFPNQSRLQHLGSGLFASNPAITGDPYPVGFKSKPQSVVHGGFLNLPVRRSTPAVLLDDEQKSIVQTHNQLDWAIQGPGFFQIDIGEGLVGYTRGGSFKRDSEGNVVTPEGYCLVPAITLSDDTVALAISRDGRLRGYDNDGQIVSEQQVELAVFPEARLLQRYEDFIFVANPEFTGTMQTGVPGSTGFGIIHGGFLECGGPFAPEPPEECFPKEE